MKHTLIPLDIIWINKDKKIIFVCQNAQPCRGITCPSIKPEDNAKYVLEINAGSFQKNNFKIGDEIDFKIN
jgi:hypothetical protein